MQWRVVKTRMISFPLSPIPPPVPPASQAFELSRVFTYKWTVNFKFLDDVGVHSL